MHARLFGWPAGLRSASIDARMANEEHLAILKQGVEAWNAWRHKNPRTRPDLDGAKLHQANLSGVILARALMSDSDLTDANLSHANISRTHLGHARLEGADLSLATLHTADIIFAHFTHANLSGADLMSADLFGADFSAADLSNVKL